MPNYLSPYNTGFGGIGQTSFSPYMQPSYYNYSYQSPNGANQYMINVDGEMAAKAWQMPNNLAPNTVIPLFDLDGQHVYFRSVDAYGRLNPLRKGRIVFEDAPQQMIAQGNGVSTSVEEVKPPNMDQYLTKDQFKSELDRFKSELKNMINQTNQNGSNSSQQQNRGNRG